MSFNCTNWAWNMVRTRGDTTAKCVLVAMAERAHDNGYTYPTIQELATKVEKSERTIKRKIKMLEQAGVITVHHHRIRANLLRNSYTLSIHHRFDLQNTKGDKMSPNSEADNVTECPHKGDTALSPGLSSKVTTTNLNIFNPERDIDSKGFVTLKLGWRPYGEICNLLKREMSPEFIEEQLVFFATEYRDQRRKGGQLDNWFMRHVRGAFEKSKREAKTIQGNFQPSEATIDLLSDSLVPMVFIVDYVGEFVLFWSDAGAKRLSWQTVFYTQCLEQWKIRRA